MIPKTIHYCWYGGADYSDIIKKCINSWKLMLPDYQIICWNESNTPFDKMPFLKILYKQKRWAFISDYMRLFTVFKYGGIYLDTDVEVVKNFDILLKEPSFIAFQTEFEKCKYPFNTAVIGGEKGNSFIEFCLQETEKLQRMSYHAMAAPSISSKVLIKNYKIKNYECKNLTNVTIFTREYFYPFAWYECFDQDCIKENTLAIHWWEDSWGSKKKNLKYFWISFLRKLEKTPNIFLSRIQYIIQKPNKFYLYNKF